MQPDATAIIVWIMKFCLKLHYLSAILLAVFVLGACAAVRPGAPAGNGEDPLRFRLEERPGNYYYYLAALDMIRRGGMEEAAELLVTAVSQDPESVLLKRELALVYLQIDKKDKALDLCEQILKDRPDNIEALIISASIRQSGNEIEEAARLYEKVLEIEPDRKNIYLVLGRLYLEDARYAEAKRVFETMVARHPDAYIGHYYLGLAFAGAGEKDHAVGSFRRAVEIEPGFMDARFELIDLYDDRDETHKVIDMYEKIISEDPGDVSAAIALGLLYLEQEYFDKAGDLFEHLGRMADIDRGVVDTVVQELIARKRYEDAIDVIEGMLKGLPDDQDLHYLAGISGYLVERYDDALYHLEQVGVRSRFYGDAALQKATIYSRLEQPADARRVLEAALEHPGQLDQSEKLRIIRFLGAFHIDAGRYDMAVDVLEQGLAIKPDSADIHYEMGIAWDRKGNREKTVEQMKTVINLDPEHADGLNYLGYTWAEEGIRLDEAEDLIRRALEIKPESGYILDSMGWVYFQKGEIDRAVPYLEQAVEKRPLDPTILEHLGDAYRELGRTEDALAFYRRALSARKESENEAPDAQNDEERRKIKAKIQEIKTGRP